MAVHRPMWTNRNTIARKAWLGAIGVADGTTGGQSDAQKVAKAIVLPGELVEKAIGKSQFARYNPDLRVFLAVGKGRRDTACRVNVYGLVVEPKILGIATGIVDRV